VTVRDRNGETSIPGVFVVGEAGAIGGAQTALAQGRLAGCKAAENLALAVPATRLKTARRELRRHRRFQDAIWSLYHAPALGLQLARDDTVICRCEEVTLGQLHPLIASGVTDLGALKRLTRAGMGRCQGRYCSLSLARLAAEHHGGRPDEFGGFAPQTPIKPVPLAALAVEKPEWRGHVPVELPAPRSASPGAEGEKDEAEVLVIGAGILGASTAYYLARRGVDVLVVDSGGVNGGASGGNAGSLHVQLLSYDVGVKEASHTAPILSLLPLQKRAIAQWRELEAALGADFEIKVTGGLMLAESDESLAFLEAKAKLERSHGLQVEVIGAHELRRLEPALADRFLGAAWCPDEGKINPLLATPAVMEAAVEAGARLHPHRAITAIEPERGGFVAHTDQGPIRAGKVVSAAGAWSAQIAGMLGLALPVQVTPMQMIVTEPAAPVVTRLVAHADRHLTMKQAASGQVIIGGGWTAGLDPLSGRPRVLQDSLEGNLWAARRVVPALSHLQVLRSWAAFSVDADGAPILGAVPGVPGFHLAVTTNGYTLGPTVGRLMAELVTSGRADFDLAPYAIDRFQ
jgi:glycine/D-amino acid oxidase-like deaminating enzyme